MKYYDVTLSVPAAQEVDELGNPAPEKYTPIAKARARLLPPHVSDVTVTDMQDVAGRELTHVGTKLLAYKIIGDPQGAKTAVIDGKPYRITGAEPAMSGRGYIITIEGWGR